MSFIDKLMLLTRQLYPTGRAFKMRVDGDLEKLHKALAISESQFKSDSLSVLDTILPDNDNFSEEDAEKWEYVLGLVSNDSVSLADRKSAITRKLNHPGTVKARENYRYVEYQLQLAGFDVYIHENRFDDGFGGLETQTPDAFSNDPFPSITVEHGEIEHGAEMGDYTSNKVVNSITVEGDDLFDEGTSLKQTWYLGAETAGDWATVDANRERELRDLILKLKPVQTVCYLLINFT